MTNTEARRTPQAAKRHLAAGLAATLSLALAVGSFPLGLSQAQAAETGNNGWQIVSGAYDASHTTSQGIKASDLINYGFVASDDGDDESQVRVTKTVEPTEVEDEFIVHLSVDTSATSTQLTDYYSFFKNAPYEATTSNGYANGGYVVGQATPDSKGTMEVKVSGTTDLGGNKGVFNIKDPQGRKIAENVTLYWSQANNVTILLDIGDLLGTGAGKEWIIMGIKVSKDSTNELQLTQEAYNLINKAIQGKTNWGDPTRLSLVTDVMGNDVEYIIDSASPDGGTTDYDNTSRTLTWNPAYNKTYTTVEETPDVVTEINDQGAVTRVTITQRKWYYGAASLTYKVRLNTRASNFKSSFDPDSVTNAFDTNEKATLKYSYSIDGGETYKEDNSVDFPKPTVKGILYDLQALKTNEVKTPLAGATFQLTRVWIDSFGDTHTDLISEDLVSDENGYVKVDSFPGAPTRLWKRRLLWAMFFLRKPTAP